jgi:two-component sensor histidine kinase
MQEKKRPFIDLSAEVEALRLDAVHRYEILDTPSDGTFDRITRLAARLFKVPIAIVSIVDSDRIWFKSHHGLSISEIPRDPGLCASAILHDQPWIVTNAKLDPRSLANPLVAGAFGLEFYLGVPLRTHDGFNLGTLCVIDKAPREPSKEQSEHLIDLAHIVMDQLEMRLSARHSVSKLAQAVVAKNDALEHARLLTKEVDHRVMNSLQLISTMLGLQSLQHQGTEAGREIVRASERINAIARVHRSIHFEEGEGPVDAMSYLTRLCADLGLGAGASADIVVQGIAVPMSADLLVPLGIVVNELITNAVKNGAARIVVSLGWITEGFCELSVEDDGHGLRGDFDPLAGKGLGMRIIDSLASSIDGTLTFGDAGAGWGARFGLLFAVPQ